MIEKPIEQKAFTNEDNYHALWTGIVSQLIESIFKDGRYFVYSYEANSKKVFNIVISNLKVVPIDLKETLQIYYNVLEKDYPEPPKSVA